jgi:1-deoxy-D-xylulose-5-phosphate reductoisomerase
MKSGRSAEVKNIILTASGGPFFGKSKEELRKVTLDDTLAHPTWKMGKKITVDSATLMNKGFEVVEAAHLFGVTPDRIKVVVHRESILHSAVEYIDNAVIGELSVPDMRMCVQYAVDYPERCESVSDELDLFALGALTFKKPDYEAFPLLALAKEAMKLGGAMPAVLNASDEIAVAAFLSEKLSFLGISEVVGEVFSSMTGKSSVTSLEGIIDADREARALAEKIISKHV